ncbi:sensor histidine kinase [Eisenbergiella tayi]|uniref:sensor histidine kinase n=1 Tax=Eisenbergiella tayi TaxID=1432052 RepID=UPI00046F4BA6|nr:histidine kinase [Eisenbergiella tayi]
MRFRYKLIVSYAALAFILSLILGIVWQYYNTREYRSNAHENLKFLSEQMTIQFDNSYNAMSQVTNYILSDQDMLGAIRGLSDTENRRYTEMISENEAILKNGISNDYFMSNFYRVIFFNTYGNIIYSTMNTDMGVINSKTAIEDCYWLEEARNLHGKPLLVGIHEDNWKADSKEKVFSMVRAVQGQPLGYIEVQQKIDRLEELFSFPEREIRTTILLEDGSLFYSTDEENLDTYRTYASSCEDNAYEDKPSDLLLSLSTSKTGAKIILSEDMRIIREGIPQTAVFSLLLVVTIFSLSMVFVILISTYLTKPIRDMRKQIEQTQLSNLDQELIINTSDNEIEALNRSYRDLLRRLSESLDKEKKLSLLQLQAQFGTLQAQVNPHFLYNVLNVISNRGMEDGDEKICDICENLAAMLRYSTSTVERYATVEQELDYLRQYVYLLKSRFEERLEVEITCEESIRRKIIPKIVLQQLVENSMLHGYNQKDTVMRIKVRGWIEENGWYISVEDNGDGMEEAVLQNLLAKLEEIRKKIHIQKSSIEMEIGQMGLANLYARMYLLYVDGLVFRLENKQESGVIITIGVKEGS